MRVLIVDDVALNRDILEDILTDEGFETMTAENGLQAMELLLQNHLDYDVVLLDLMMPRMDGFAVLKEMQERRWLEDTPVIVISGENDAEAEQRSLKLGAVDFIHKPFNQNVVVNRATGTAARFSYQRALKRQVRQQTEKLQQQYTELQSLTWQISETNRKIIDLMGTIVEFRNLESGEHIQRVKMFTCIMGQTMMQLYPDSGLTEEQLDLIVAASPLHDIGKITVSDTILLKPCRLTPEEFELMKAHTTSGVEILRSISGIWDEAYGQVSYDICRYHHERYDGRGYPDGLKGEEIPLSAQLVSIADVYDALVSPRVYKKAFSLEAAYEMILGGQCGVFSPRLLDCFRHARNRLEAQAKEPEDIPVSPSWGGVKSSFPLIKPSQGNPGQPSQASQKKPKQLQKSIPLIGGGIS